MTTEKWRLGFNSVLWSSWTLRGAIYRTQTDLTMKEFSWSLVVDLKDIWVFCFNLQEYLLGDVVMLSVILVNTFFLEFFSLHTFHSVQVNSSFQVLFQSLHISCEVTGHLFLARTTYYCGRKSTRVQLQCICIYFLHLRFQTQLPLTYTLGRCTTFESELLLQVEAVSW